MSDETKGADIAKTRTLANDILEAVRDEIRAVGTKPEHAELIAKATALVLSVKPKPSDRFCR